MWPRNVKALTPAPLWYANAREIIYFKCVQLPEKSHLSYRRAPFPVFPLSEETDEWKCSGYSAMPMAECSEMTWFVMSEFVLRNDNFMKVNHAIFFLIKQIKYDWSLYST